MLWSCFAACGPLAIEKISEPVPGHFNVKLGFLYQEVKA